MTNLAGQRMEPAMEATSPLAEIPSAEKVHRTGKQEYTAPRRWTPRRGRGDMVTVADPPGCAPEPSGPMGW